MIAGVDGYKKKWIAAIEDEAGMCVKTVNTLSELTNDPRITLIVVDVPIGLLASGTRKADTEARALLKGRACCVFTALIRPLLGCKDYPEASACRRSIEEKGLSKQAWEIRHKIREVDELMQDPFLRTRIREGHPEVSFAVMNTGTVIMSGKRTPSGEHQRLSLLRTQFGDAPDYWITKFPRSAHNDVIDAFSMLWTASRVAKGCHQILGGEITHEGIRAEIVV